MKQLQVILLLFLFITVSGCASLNTGSTLVGKWRLTETLSDPGDGSGKWRPVDSKESYLTFSINGTVTSTDSPDYQSYAILDSTKLEFTLKNSRKQVVSYSIEGAALILSPQCIEACGSKYIRVN